MPVPSALVILTLCETCQRARQGRREKKKRREKEWAAAHRLLDKYTRERESKSAFFIASLRCRRVESLVVHQSSRPFICTNKHSQEKNKTHVV